MMTETERHRHWLATNDHPRDLLEMVEEILITGSLERRWRLCICAWAQRVVHLAKVPAAPELIKAAERYADGEVPIEILESLWRSQDRPAESFTPASQAFLATLATGFRSGDPHTFNLAVHAADDAASASGNMEIEWGTQAAIVKDIFGNPFRPITFNPAWLTSTVLALANGIYQEKAFDRMPILADALQDSGCDCEDILNHCRQPGEHVRGCWLVDLLLGKSKHC
jgi:hypothetical protein